MEVAKITSRGQITIPIDIRKKLGVREGDKVIFIEDQGRIVVANAAKIAFANMQKAFAGEAERLGLQDEEDVVALVDEIRDPKDLPILVSAINEDVDILLSGDTDFAPLDLEHPEVLTPRGFVEKYC